MPLLQEQIAAMSRATAGSQHGNSLACCRGCAFRSAGGRAEGMPLLQEQIAAVCWLVF